jgi:hypothetical protein
MSQAFADPPRLIGDLILAELLQVFARDTDYRTARKLLLELPCASIWSAEKVPPCRRLLSPASEACSHRAQDDRRLNQRVSRSAQS